MIDFFFQFHIIVNVVILFQWPLFTKFHKESGYKRGRLFQRPSLKENSVRWYESAPMEHTTIGKIMPYLSEKAGLSRRYTNHYVRATSVHVLDNIGNFASRHIMTVTGHKSENSIKTYTGYTGDAIKKSMSDTISKTVLYKWNIYSRWPN